MRFWLVAAVVGASLMPGVMEVGAARAQVAPLAPGAGDGTMMMTVFLKHDQSKNLKEINDAIFKQGYFDQFPPSGVEVVSWTVVMGIGQVIVLRFPPSKLREINVVLENTMWGPYRTEFYPTYDYKELAEQQRRMMLARPRN